MAGEAPERIESDPVTAWFQQHLDGVRPPLRFELISGGRSNLTYTVTDSAEGRWVLRRPPLGHVDGHVARDRATVERVFPPGVRPSLAHEVIDVLARLHAVDPDTVGLGK